MDELTSRLRAELRREFDAQVVETPPPQRARYGQAGGGRGGPARHLPWPRLAPVLAALALGVMIGLAAHGGRIVSPAPRGQLGTAPHVTPSPGATVQPSPTAPRPSPSATTSARQAPPRQQAAPPGAPAGPPALDDDFEADAAGANPPTGWRVDDGRWTGVVSDGSHTVRHDAAQPLAHLVAGSPRWSDYAVTADVRTDPLGLGYAGVAGRYQGPGDTYECDVTVGGQLQLRLLKGGERRVLAVSGVSLDLSGVHTVRLEMRGSQLTCALDGTSLVRATDATLSSGRVALVASAGEAADFDNVHVSA